MKTEQSLKHDKETCYHVLFLNTLPYVVCGPLYFFNQFSPAIFASGPDSAWLFPIVKAFVVVTMTTSTITVVSLAKSHVKKYKERKNNSNRS